VGRIGFVNAVKALLVKGNAKILQKIGIGTGGPLPVGGVAPGGVARQR